MLDIGWTELLLIGVVALIVVGPKDFPGMMRTLGRVTGRMRSMAREFNRAMEKAADEAGVKDVAADLKTAASARSLGLDKIQESALKYQNEVKSSLKGSVSSSSESSAAVTRNGSAEVNSIKPELPSASEPNESVESDQEAMLKARSSAESTADKEVAGTNP